MSNKVLIIEDNHSVAEALRLLLELNDVEAEIAFTPQAGLERLQQAPDVGLVIQDMNFTEDTTSGDEGKKLFEKIRDCRPNMPVILITAWTQLETAIELVKKGAADYIAKPWDDHKLVVSVRNLLELGELQQQRLEQARDLMDEQRELASRADLCGIVYQSRKMHELVAMAVKVARTDLPVLITGPNGSGKEKIAHILQANSSVRNGPFICVNVGALPQELIEAELFGAEAGAFTGITKRRIGRFEAADGGTLFLDELGNLSASGQAKLLRVLQTGQYERVGSSETRRCQVRVISATNADLHQAIARGEFREDLLYRLNVFELHVAPLTERREDILPLLHHFLGDVPTLEPATVRALQAYHWPGNVRELENACNRARVLSEGTNIRVEDFGLNLSLNVDANPRDLAVEPSRAMIEAALRQNHGVVAHAARQLGLSRQALYRRLEKYQIIHD